MSLPLKLTVTLNLIQGLLIWKRKSPSPKGELLSERQKMDTFSLWQMLNQVQHDVGK